MDESQEVVPAEVSAPEQVATAAPESEVVAPEAAEPAVESKTFTQEELDAAREGARVAIDTQMNGFKSAARRGTDVGQSDFNQQRIEALFGKEEAAKLFKNRRLSACF